MKAKTRINKKIIEIQRIGYTEILRLARKILKKYKRPYIFTMAMGTYVFEDKNGNNLYQTAYTRELDNFLCDLDIMFGFTGCATRITKDLKIDKTY